MNILPDIIALRDKQYADYQRRLLPTLPPESIIGVRTPALRTLAKKLAKDPGIEEFLAALPHTTFEENQLHAFIISLERDFSRCLQMVEAFLPHIDNWATCDQLSPTCFTKHHADLLPHIRRWMASQHEYTVRFGIGMLLRHFLDADFTPEHLQWVVTIRRDEYYIQMMQAWYLATALAKQWDATLPLIPTLPTPLRRMTIRKACESFRISDENKKLLRNINIQ
ncbi:MAG: DNA alkylation repair protein [Bacteroidales bacterium]|nr:DNA alkylation repair protein [Bacteroidales bacterium]